MARTGLIFTGIQEGAQPGGLTQPQPGQAKPGIPYHVPSCWAPVGGSGAAGISSWLGSARRQSGRERLCSAGLCSVFPLSVSLLLLFPLFAVLLNCPYPDPPVSACFFPFSSAPRLGEGQPRGAFVDGCSQTITVLQEEQLRTSPEGSSGDRGHPRLLLCNSVIQDFREMHSTARDLISQMLAYQHTHLLKN